MPPEMAQAMSVAEGSIPEMQAHMDEILEDSKELFEELKRLGD